MKSRVKLSSIFIGALFLFGLLLVLYPFVSNGLNNYLDDKLIETYQNQANKKNETEMEAAKKKWVEKNEQLLKDANNQVIGADTFSTKKKESEKPEKNYYEQQTIAYLNIPKIKVKVPVFNGTNDLLLEKGAGLLEGTSYPIGGMGTHAVLSAHRGLETAKLFTDLPKLVMGDTFIITIAQEKHAYKVDKISVIEPDDIELLRVVDEQDYVTLMTCTPFMVNSHRLLVRGHRIPYTEELKEDVKKSEHERNRGQLLLITFCLIIFCSVIFFTVRKIKVGNR